MSWKASYTKEINVFKYHLYLAEEILQLLLSWKEMG